MLVLGAQLAEVPASEKDSLRIKNGVKVTSLGEGKHSAAGVKKDFIMTTG